MKQYKTGIVFEGGSMRGLFTAGVMDVLMGEGIEFDGGIGVSAGVAFGCNYKSRQQKRVLRYTKRFAKDPRFAGFRSLIKTGDVFNAEFGYELIPNKYDRFDYKAFEENPMEFYCVATDCITGQAVYHKFSDCRGADIQWIRASASMPLVSRPVQIGDRLFLDGGISDSIPLKYFEQIGYEKNVVVLTRSAEYRKEPLKYMPAVKLALRDYPRIIRSVETRPRRYNDTVKYIHQRESEGDVFVIQPPVELGIPPVCHDREEIKRVYKIGVDTMQKKLEELREFLR